MVMTKPCRPTMAVVALGSASYSTNARPGFASTMRTCMPSQLTFSVHPQAQRRCRSLKGLAAGSEALPALQEDIARAGEIGRRTSTRPRYCLKTSSSMSAVADAGRPSTNSSLFGGFAAVCTRSASRISRPSDELLCRARHNERGDRR